MKKNILKGNFIVIVVTFLLLIFHLLNLWVFKYTYSGLNYITYILYIMNIVSITVAFVYYIKEKTRFNFYLILVSYIPLITTALSLIIVLYQISEFARLFG